MATVGSGRPGASARTAPTGRGSAVWARAALLRAGVALLGALVLLAIGARVVTLVQVGLLEGDDFTPYWNGALAVAAGASPYGWLAENRPQAVPDYIYPPLLALLLAPFARVLDATSARWGWLVLSTASLATATCIVWH